jgi:hypothetical protein
MVFQPDSYTSLAPSIAIAGVKSTIDFLVLVFGDLPMRIISGRNGIIVFCKRTIRPCAFYNKLNFTFGLLDYRRTVNSLALLPFLADATGYLMT